MKSAARYILQGTLVLLVLRTLTSNKRMHGYAMTNHIQRVSADLLRVEEGSLYPALHRMEQQGWLRSEWGMTAKNREARFYALPAQGRKQLVLAAVGYGIVPSDPFVTRVQDLDRLLSR